MVPAPNQSRRSLGSTLRCASLTAASLLSACVYFPKDGPLRSEVADQSRETVGTPFVLVPVSATAIDATAVATPGFAETFGDAPTIEPLLSVGDGVSLTVFEAGSEPLFSNGTAAANGIAASRGVSLPEQSIALDGSITVPFAGPVHAAGLTVQQLEDAVEKALTGRASHPQIVASVSHTAGSAVTVLGEQGAGARVPLSAYGERLLDVLAGSGGLRGSVFDTWVELRRGDSALRLPLSRVLRESKQNIRLQPGDIVLVTHRPETFTVFGATGRNAQIEFGAERVSLTEAVAKAGGLQDVRADPRGVYLFRYEPLAVAEKLGAARIVGPEGAAVVYQFDFLQTSSYFLSQRFAMRDGDVLYVASAPVNELQKFLQLIGLVTQPILSGVAVDNALSTQ
jgi:polysaccharide export outer membrane protein